MIQQLLDMLAGKPLAIRSPKWPEVRRRHLVIQPRCQVCGGSRGLNVHHKKPVHAFPHLELDECNLITLCELNGCHFLYGHGRNWTCWIDDVEEQCSLARAMIANRKRVV